MPANDEKATDNDAIESFGQSQRSRNRSKSVKPQSRSKNATEQLAVEEVPVSEIIFIGGGDLENLKENELMNETAKLVDAQTEQPSICEDTVVESFGQSQRSRNRSKSVKPQSRSKNATEQLAVEEVPAIESTTNYRKALARPVIIQTQQLHTTTPTFTPHSEKPISKLPLPGNYGYRGVTNVDYSFPYFVKIFRLNVTEIGATAYYVDGSRRSFVFSQLAKMFSSGEASPTLVFDVENENVCNQLTASQETVNAVQAFRTRITDIAFRGTVNSSSVRMFTADNKRLQTVSMCDIKICPATVRDSLGYDTLKAIYGAVGPNVNYIKIDLRSTKIVSFNLAVKYMNEYFYDRTFLNIEIAAMKSCNRNQLSDSVQMIKSLLSATGTAFMFVHEYHNDFIAGLFGNGIIATGDSITYSMRGSETDIQWFDEYHVTFGKKHVFFYLAKKDRYEGDLVGYEETLYNLANMSI